ncbi:MAG TPA: transcriptional activator NhaR [Vicinamibacterales bacterium]
MEWLNYHHLLYFWTVVREGGVSKAAEKLRLAQPTVSAQIRQLDKFVGEPLFERRGRGLVLTDVGRLVFRYADEIFAIGGELLNAVRGRPSVRPVPLTVGVADAVPKLVVHRLLQPVLGEPDRLHLIVREDKPEALVTRLASHAMDVVISDGPAPPSVRVKVFNHLLGESGLTLFAPARVAARLRRRFPASLDGAPMLLPTDNTATRRALDQWFDGKGIAPRVLAEFEDSALLKVFGEEQQAVFVAPTAIEDEIVFRYRVRIVGRVPEVRERYYAITVGRRLKHPGVVALTAAAREDVFR